MKNVVARWGKGDEMKLIDLTWQRFGRLVVVERAETRVSPCKSKSTMWRCKCDCGNVVDRSLSNLKGTPVPSCGCYKSERTSARKLNDLVGRRFGRLVVTERAENAPSGLTRWKCKCDCGNECIVIANNLMRNHTTSCGCFKDESRISVHTKHGLSDTRIYGVYGKIKARCYNENNPSYPRYGGRGITMCDEWKNDPEAFCEWAYAHNYREDADYGECTVDRIDNNEGYSPENCRIADEKTQANNRRSNLIIEHNGEKKTLAQWRDYFGMTQWQAYKNFVVYKRSVQDVIENGIA